MNRETRILFVLTSYPPAVGGAQIHTHELSKQLSRRSKTSVQVITQWSQFRTDWLLGTTLRAPAVTSSYSVDGLDVTRMGLPRRDKVKIAPATLGYYLFKTRAIRRISDVMCRRIEELAGPADVVHNVRIGRENISYAALKLARRRGVPFVFVPNHHPRWVGWNYRSFVELYRRADAILALTHAEAETLEALGVAPDRIHVTGIGPVLAESADGAAARRSLGLDGEPVVLFLGQKYEYKGYRALLEATERVWRRHPAARFVFVGPRTRTSRRVFGSVKDPRVIEIGSVSLQDKTNLIGACDLLCVPSSQEAFGGVFTEAWALGRPVIGGVAPAIREVIDDEVDGLIAPQDPAVLAEQIDRLLADPEWRQSLASRGFEKVQNRFSWTLLADRVYSVYRSLGVP